MPRPLPMVITPANKARVGLGTLAILVATYSVTNSLRLSPPTVLAPGWLDARVPLVPATVWVYLSYPLVFLSAYAIESDPGQLTRFFYADVAANVVSEGVFVLWPTAFARPPLAPAGARQTLSEAALQLLWRCDAPVNCFPSLHVSTTLLPALMLWRNHRRLSCLYLAWAAAIMASTMTTRQHHSVDVLGGAVLAAVTYWAFFVRASYAGAPAGGGARPAVGRAP